MASTASTTTMTTSAPVPSPPLATDESPSLRARKPVVSAPAWQRLTRKISKTFGHSVLKTTSTKRLLAAAPVAVDAAKQKSSSRETRAAALVALGRDVKAKDDGNGQSHRPRGPSEVHTDDALSTTSSSSSVVGSIASSHRGAASPAPAIPAAYPLVQYVAECCVVLTQTQAALSAPASAQAHPQSAASDVEMALFQTCLRLRKWPLAQTLAARLERRVVRHVQDLEASARQPRDSVVATERILHLSASAHQDDVILRFLDSCASA